MGRLEVAVRPGTREPGIALRAGVVTISVRERAIDGGANAAVLRAVAEWLDVAPSRVSLARGAASRRKLLEVDGLDREALAVRISALGK